MRDSIPVKKEEKKKIELKIRKIETEEAGVTVCGLTEYTVE